MHVSLFNKIKKMKAVTFFIITIVSVPLVSFAAAMSSSNYKIESDSINIGGSFGSRTNYILEDTIEDTLDEQVIYDFYE